MVRDGSFRVSRVVDLSHREAEQKYLEGTGSLVLDRVRRVAYACASPRTHPELVAEWAQELQYEPVVFQAAEKSMGISFALIGCRRSGSGPALAPVQ